MTGSRPRHLLLPFVLVGLVLATCALAHGARAQATPALSDESLLSMVLPPLADGSRPPVHYWARADQPNGPGDLPTVFVVTLYTHQGAAGPEEREVINYVQYSGGSWAPVRPQDAGSLLVDDWAWVSLHLANLTAAAQGQGDTSQYTVDYDAKGSYNGAPRELVIEEVYGADLSLVSSSVISDTSGQAAAAPVPAASATPMPTSVPATATPSSSATPPGSTPAAGVPQAAPPAASVVAAARSAPNLIRSGPPASADAACGSVLSAQGYTWSGGMKSLGAIAGQPVIVCTPSGPQTTATAGPGYGCMLVGGQTTTLDGNTACFGFSAIQPQGDGNFLVVGPSDAASVQVQPIAWSGGGFASGQSYAACTANIAIPVTNTSDCSSGT